MQHRLCFLQVFRQAFGRELGVTGRLGSWFNQALPFSLKPPIDVLANMLLYRRVNSFGSLLWGSQQNLRVMVALMHDSLQFGKHWVLLTERWPGLREKASFWPLNIGLCLLLLLLWLQCTLGTQDHKMLWHKIPKQHLRVSILKSSEGLLGTVYVMCNFPSP